MSMQNSDGHDVQALIEALQAQLDRQEKQIQSQAEQIRQLQRSRNWFRNSHSGIMIGLLMAIVFAILFWDGRFALAMSHTGSEPDGLVDGANVQIASINSPTSALSAPTYIYNPEGLRLSRNLLWIDNKASTQLQQPVNSRIAIIGSTSGYDNVTGNIRVGVLGWADTAGVTSTDGYGVWGKGTGERAIGVFGESVESAGVLGKSTSNLGVYGFSSSGVGILGYSQSQYGVSGSSDDSYGGSFYGGLAPLRLIPATTPGAPNLGTHKMGELYVDSVGNLYFCTQDGTPGTWAKLNLSTVYLPSVTK
ncbi:MAG: hypothetical protein EHM41_13275 [Chloroflexi bacterium]|nr:MAG: hypothetical protein EHM41_13275 [Chloroflexota bacterium]